MPPDMADDPNRVISHGLMARFSAVLKDAGGLRDLLRQLDDDRGANGDANGGEEEPGDNGGDNADAYWTEERIAGAAPFPLKPLAEDPGEPSEQDELETIIRGIGIQSRKLSELPADARSTQFKALTAPAYDTERVPNLGDFPYRAIGKLLATMGGADFAGTAWVIGERSIVTAGHCVFDETAGQWATNVAFMPQFDARPTQGIWQAGSIHTLAGWAAGGRRAAAFDIGGAVLAKPVAQLTGRIGWRANITPDQGMLHSVGYPGDWISATYDFDGKHMWSCNGRYVGGTAVMGMNNNMTRGSSGGPWLVQDDRNRIFACGLNSHYGDGRPVMYSPYFGQGIINLVNTIG